MPQDPYSNDTTITGAGREAKAIVPSDSAELATVTRCLYIGTSGDITVDFPNGVTETLKNHPVGYAPLRVKRVRATGTTAQNIVGIY